MDVGFGGYFNAGQISNNFGPSGLASIGFGWNYKKWNYDLNLLAGSSTAQQDMVVENKAWAKGTDLDLFLLKLSLGYDVWDNERFEFSPNFGIVYTNYSPSQYNSQNQPINSDIKYTTKNFMHYSLGFNYDIKFKPKNNRPEFKGFISFIRLSYGLNIPSINYSGYNGIVNYFTVGFGFGVRKTKRDL